LPFAGGEQIEKAQGIPFDFCRPPGVVSDWTERALCDDKTGPNKHTMKGMKIRFSEQDRLIGYCKMT